MSDRALTLLKRCGVAALLGGAVTLFLFWSRGGFEAATRADLWRLLSDAFLIPGLCMVFAGLMTVIINDGFFYGLGYAFNRVKDFCIPGRAALRKMESYGDYVARKREEKPITGYACLFIVGGAFLLLAILFIALFYA